MNNIKDKLEIIIGYSAVIISLSAFKSELTNIKINLSFFKFSLADYLFGLIIAFVITLHFYFIPYFFSSTKYFYLRIFKHIETITFSFFGFVLLSPFLLLLAVTTNSLVLQIQNFPISLAQESMKYVTIIISVIFVHFSNLLVSRYKKEKTLEETNRIEEEEIKMVEIAQKLINDGYYNQSIVQSVKILENNIYKILKTNQLVITRSSLLNMINVAHKYKLIDNEQIQKINKIRILRNNIVHLQNMNATKKEAEETLNVILNLAHNSPDNVLESELIEGEN